MRRHNTFGRKQYVDCPLAIVGDNLSFPGLGHMPNGEEPISVNMMPFDLFDPENTLPSYLHGYLPLILKCRDYNKPYNDYLYTTGVKTLGVIRYENILRFDHTQLCNRIAYLTVDERPIVNSGDSHRRGGVHIECPGSLRSKEIADKSQYTSDLSWYHRWGMGEVRDEYFVGGIFIASNVSGTTAVWNCRVHDTFGDIIGPHGSLERCRDVLGPPTKILDAGELIWMSDRTPHESLPVLDNSIRRQFFRLVVGEISFWLPAHNTPNPLGFNIPDNVKIIEGNKFDWSREIAPVVWECGNKKEIDAAQEESDFRSKLYSNHVGMLADDLARMDVTSVKKLKANYKEVRKFIDNLDPQYYNEHTSYFVLSSISNLLY